MSLESQFIRPKDVIKPDHVAATLGDVRRDADRVFVIVSQDRVMAWDGYKVVENGRESWYVIAICPVCGTILTVDDSNKKMLVDDKGLHIAEPIRCTAPAQFGGMCPWHVAIEPPSKKSEQFVDTKGTRLKVDAIAKRC